MVNNLRFIDHYFFVKVVSMKNKLYICIVIKSANYIINFNKRKKLSIKWKMLIFRKTVFLHKKMK